MCIRRNEQGIVKDSQNLLSTPSNDRDKWCHLELITALSNHSWPITKLPKKWLAETSQTLGLNELYWSLLDRNIPKLKKRLLKRVLMYCADVLCLRGWSTVLVPVQTHCAGGGARESIPRHPIPTPYSPQILGLGPLRPGLWSTDLGPDLSSNQMRPRA